MPSNTSIVDTVNTVLERQADKRPTSAVVYGIDGDRIDIQVNGSVSIIRHVQVVGGVDTVSVGDSVQIIWQPSGRPVALLPGGGGGVSRTAAVVTPDNSTIENSSSGLRVKQGGIGREHLGFDIADDVASSNPLLVTGWKIDSDGSLYHSGIRISPT